MAADRQTAIGAFVLAGTILAIGAIVLFGNFRLFSPTRRAAIVFEGSVSGLAVGAPVNFRGVRVGAVTSVAIVFDAKSHTAYIPVTVELEPDRVRVAHRSGAAGKLDLTTLIARGLRAQLNTQSFVTGQSEINLDFAPATKALLHPAMTSLPEIPTQQSTIQRVTERLSQLPLQELVGDAVATLASVKVLTARLDTDLPPLIASVKATSDRSAYVVDTASHAITDLQGRLDATLGGVTRLITQATENLGARDADLHTLLLSANETAQQTHTVLSNLESLTAPRGNNRANIDSALRDIAAAAASLRGFANDVEHNPQLLLTGRRR